MPQTTPHRSQPGPRATVHLDRLEFYALNSGHRLSCPREAVRPETTCLLRPLWRHGGPLPSPFGAYTVEVAHAAGGALFTLSSGSRVICTAGLAWTRPGAAEIWPHLEGLYLRLSDRYSALMGAEHVPSPPGAQPWLGEVMLPGCRMSATEPLNWIGEFERCLGWTILLERQAAELGAAPA